MKLKTLTFFAAFTVLLSSFALAQDQPVAGVIQPFSTVETHEYDTINLATLGIQLNVPVRSKAGHIPFSFVLRGGAGVIVRSNINAQGIEHFWWSGGAGMQGMETHVGSPGDGPMVRYSFTETRYCGTGIQPKTGYSEWVYTDLVGAAHPVGIPTLWWDSACGPTSAGAYTADGSGIYVYTDPGWNGYAIDSNGNTVLFGAYSTSSFTDPSGNALSYTSTLNGLTHTNTYTDTLSSQPPITQVVNSTISPQETDTWKDALGNDRQVKLYTTTYPLLASFGCPLDQALPAVNSNFPTQISFPDGSTLSYGYERNYSNSADYTGRLASITLPTGGMISYAYSGGTQGINCLDATSATVTRTTPDGIWTYTHTPTSPTTTQVTDPKLNNIVYTFVTGLVQLGEFPAKIPLQTEKQVYNGTVSPSHLIQTIITCYNNPTSTPTNCNASPLNYPITEKDEYTSYPGVTGYSAVKTTYDTYGRVTDVKTFDFNATSPTNEKVITYGSGNPTSQTCTAISTYIIGKPCSVTLLDSQHSNAILSQTWNAYDSNGNLLQTWNLASGSGATGTYLSKQYMYDSHGVVQTATDVNGQVMNYTTTSCNNMFVTSQYPTNFSNLATSQTWDCNGGVVTSATDANGQTTQTKFYVNTQTDPFYRPLEDIDQLGNTTSFTYTPTTFDSTFLFNGNASVVETLSTTDTIGRPVVSQLRQGPSNANWNTKSRTFDSDGRVYQTSLPCVEPAETSCPASTESQTYDALNRPFVHTGTGGDIVTKQYVTNDVLTTLTPAPSGENAKATQKEFDGLGRLKSVCVISSATGSGSCGQANGKTGFLTQYVYDAAGRLLQMVENAQVSSPQQSRSSTYDLLGRVLTETNPESQTTYFTYDAVVGTNCTSASAGDLVQKQDANGNISCYHYDGLRRNTYTTYTGPNSNNVSKYFVYDAATVNGVAMTNVEGRMAEAYTCAGSAPPTCTPTITDEGFGYDQRGQMSAYYQKSPTSNGYYSLTAMHWEDGGLKAVSGVGLPTLTYGGLDGEGRVTTVSASGGTNPVSSVTYNNGSYTTEPIGALLATTLGAGDQQNFTYELNTGRMTNYSASVGATPKVISGSLSWNPNGTLLSNNIVDGYNSADTQNCTYAYDDFIRVAGVNCVNGSTNIWNQAFTYGTDSFGNLTKTTSGPGVAWACTACYNTATNQYNSLLSGSIAYDANGDLTNDTFHTYTWLADGHVASIATGSTTVSVTYDALGNKVQENNGGTIHEYVSAFGVNARMTRTTENATTVALPGGVQALYSGGTLLRFRFPDWEGTIRAESNAASRTFTESLAFAPFGERYALKGAPYNVDSFTGSPDQMVSDEYDFAAREEHNGQGRWISPDPMRGTGNKYAYADNNPLSKVDFGGLFTMTPIGFADMQAWADSEMNRGDPLLQSESHAPQSIQTGGIASSENAYLNRVDAAFESTQTPADYQRLQRQDGEQRGQPAQNTVPTIQGVAATQTFHSEKEAAIAAEKAAVGQTRDAAKKSKYEEWGGWVITKDGKNFTYTVPVTFHDSGHFFNFSVTVPDGYAQAAAYHTHPDPGSWGEGFSPGDIKFAKDNQMNTYVGMSYSGNVRQFVPGQTRDNGLNGVSGDLIYTIP